MKIKHLPALLLLSTLLLTACTPAPSAQAAPPSASSGAGEETSGRESLPTETAGSETTETAEAAEAAPSSAPASLEGLTLSILGDSISTFEGYIPSDYSAYYPENGKIKQVEDMWWYQVLEATGMKLGGNASYSNSEVTGDSTSVTDGLAACSFRRINDLKASDGSSPDIILVYTGINDFLHCREAGSFTAPAQQEEGEILVFSDAYELMLQKTMAAYPEAQLYLCTLTETDAGDVKDPRSYPSTNENGNVIADFNQIIREIAAAYGLPLIDLHECGITYQNVYELTGDGLHPRPSGAKLIADKVLETLQPAA